MGAEDEEIESRDAAASVAVGGVAVGSNVASKDVATAMIHLYRGELGRMTTYRVRLDTTTNWAVGTSAALISFTLGNSEAPHYVLMLATFLLVIFAWMEARRFQVFEMIRLRVRLLERGFFTELLDGDALEGWRETLRADLEKPHPPIRLVQALSVRVRRNYLWLVGAVYAAWMLKLHIGEGTFPETASIGPMSGVTVIGLSIALVIGLVGLTFVHRVRERG